MPAIFACRVITGTASDIHSSICGGIGALRGPKHGGANEVAYDIQQRYSNPSEAESDIKKRIANKEIIIGFGHPVYTTGDPRNKIIKSVSKKLCAETGSINIFKIAERIESVMWKEKNVSKLRLVFCSKLQSNGHSYVNVYTNFRHE